MAAYTQCRRLCGSAEAPRCFPGCALPFLLTPSLDPGELDSSVVQNVDVDWPFAGSDSFGHSRPSQQSVFTRGPVLSGLTWFHAF